MWNSALSGYDLKQFLSDYRAPRDARCRELLGSFNGPCGLIRQAFGTERGDLFVQLKLAAVVDLENKGATRNGLQL
jgi:hypothetical protein